LNDGVFSMTVPLIIVFEYQVLQKIIKPLTNKMLWNFVAVRIFYWLHP